MDIWQGVPLFEGHVIRANGPFCDVLHSRYRWGGVISLLIVEIPLMCVTVLVRAPPLPSLFASIKSYQVISWYLSTCTVYCYFARGKIKARAAEESSFRRHLVIYLANFLSPCPRCMFPQEVILRASPGALSASTCMLFLRV